MKRAQKRVYPKHVPNRAKSPFRQESGCTAVLPSSAKPVASFPRQIRSGRSRPSHPDRTDETTSAAAISIHPFGPRAPPLLFPRVPRVLTPKPRRHDAAAAAAAAAMGNGAAAPTAVLPGGPPPATAPAVLPGGASASRYVGSAAAAGCGGAGAGTVRRRGRGRC
jgi:hypothetical protein